MIDNVLIFLKNIFGSFWGRLFKSSWVYRTILRFTGYYSKTALVQAQKFEDGQVISTASNQYMIPVLIQIPLSKIHTKVLMLDGSWAVGTAVIGQAVSTENTVVQVQLPSSCTGLSVECTGNYLLVRDADFLVKDTYFVLTVDPFKLFKYVHMQNGEPYFDVWVYGVPTEASLDNFSVLTNTDLNQIPKSGKSVWESYVEGLTEDRLNQIISAGLGVDLAKVSGIVRNVWTEGNYRFISVEGSVHSAPIQYETLVVPGDEVAVLQQLFDTHSLYTKGQLPEYSDISEIALPVSPGRFVKIPNYMVQVKDYLGIKYLELATTMGSFTDSVKDVITNYQVQGIADGITAVNALQYVMDQVFRNDFIILKFHHVTEDKVPALQAIAQAVSSTKPLYACVAVAIEPSGINSCSLGVTESSDAEGAGNPDTEAVNLVCAPGTQKIDFV